MASGTSHHFSRVAAGTWSIFSRYGGNGHSKFVFFQRCQDSCLLTRDTSGISRSIGRAIRMLLAVRRETEGHFLVATMILGFLSIFTKSQRSSPFEALNSECLSQFQRDVRPPVQMRQGPWAFSKVSTVDSDIHSSCEMKDEPAFKPLQENRTFIQVRASRCPFHVRQQTQGPSHIPIPEGSLHLRCLWKVAIPLHSKPENPLSSGDDLGCTELSLSCCAEIGVPLDLRRVSQSISGVA